MCCAELSFFDPAEPKAGVAFCYMCDYTALAHRPAWNTDVVQKYDIDHFIAFQLNIGLDMNPLVADIQCGCFTKAYSGAKELNAQLAGNTPIVSVFHKQSSSCTNGTYLSSQLRHPRSNRAEISHGIHGNHRKKR
jgi:hypothetical protein